MMNVLYALLKGELFQKTKLCESQSEEMASNMNLKLAKMEILFLAMAAVKHA